MASDQQNTRHYEKNAIIARMRSRRADSSGQLKKEHRTISVLLYGFVGLAALLFLVLVVAAFTG